MTFYRHTDESFFPKNRILKKVFVCLINKFARRVNLEVLNPHTLVFTAQVLVHNVIKWFYSRWFKEVWHSITFIFIIEILFTIYIKICIRIVNKKKNLKHCVTPPCGRSMAPLMSQIVRVMWNRHLKMY